MQEELDDSLKVDVLANALRMGKAESVELLETLAIRLSTILPESTTIERDGWFFQSCRSVKKLTVSFDDCHLQLIKEKTGTVSATVMKVVRGVVLKTSSVSLDEWIKSLAAELSKAAENNTQTRDALNAFVIG